MEDENITTIVPSTSVLQEVESTTRVTLKLENDRVESYTESSTTIVQTALSSWNSTKMEVTTSIPNTTNKTCRTTTVNPFDEFGPPEGVEYIFVPLGVMIFVIVLSAVVLIVSRRRKLERLRHRLMPLYNFDPGEEGEDDWETELLDDGFGNRQRRQGYQSMDSEENAELFGPHRPKSNETLPPDITALSNNDALI